MIVIAIAIVLLPVMTACSQISSGRVIAKQHEPGHYSYYESCSYIGKSMFCHPMPFYVAPSWELDLRQSAKESGWRDVTESDYDRYKVGDWYDANAGSQ